MHIRTSRKKTLILALTVLVLLIIAVTIYMSRTQPKPVSGTIKTANTPATSVTNSGTDSTSSANEAQNTPDKSSSVAQSSATGDLTAPYGSFVNNHTPGQNGSDMNMLSQCNTSPGAVCYIKLTQDNVVRTLPEKTADSSGSIYWEWKISDAGLTTGKWKIEAVAKLGSQSKSTADQLSLEVQ